MMVHDNQPGYPMVIRVRLTLTGTVYLDMLATAFRAIVQWHPLLSASIRPAAFGWQWQRGEPPALRLLERSRDSLGYEYLHAPAIDLTQDPGLIVEVDNGGGVTTIDLWVHHACSDGIGLYRFLQEWMIGYENCLEGRHPEEGLAPADATQLLARNRFPLRPGTAWERWRRLVFGLQEALNFGALRSTALGKAAGFIDPDGPRHYLTLQITGRELQLIERQAARLGCRLNDIFIAAVLRAIASWRGRLELDTAKEIYSLLVPCNPMPLT